MSLTQRATLVSASAVFVVAVVALLVGVDVGSGAEPAASPTVSATDAPQSTTTTELPTFPPLASGSDVSAVRAPGGLVLPVVGGASGQWEVLTPCENRAVVDGVPVRRPHVVLDPGHGGSEPGAVGPSGLLEKDLNLDIALRVRDKLAAEGADVVLTRDADVRLTLRVRGEIARRLDPLAFISIHHNAGPMSTAPTPGSELYHHLADPESRRLAGLLWEEYQEHLAPFGTDWAIGDDPGARARRSLTTGDDFYGVLRHSQGVPGVISEAGYLSHPPEDALLRTEAFREAEAQAITDAVVRLVTTPDPGSGYRPVKEAPAPAGGGGGTAGCVDPPL